MLFVFGHHITIDYLCWNPILEYCLNAYRNIHLYQCHQTSIIIYFTFILPFSVFALFYVGSQGSTPVSQLNGLETPLTNTQYLPSAVIVQCVLNHYRPFFVLVYICTVVWSNLKAFVASQYGASKGTWWGKKIWDEGKCPFMSLCSLTKSLCFFWETLRFLGECKSLVSEGKTFARKYYISGGGGGGGNLRGVGGGGKKKHCNTVFPPTSYYCTHKSFTSECKSIKI